MKTTITPARSAVEAAASEMGALPEWNLADLYPAMDSPQLVADLDEALWDAHFAVHAEAPAFLARDFAAQLPDAADGNIVNIVDARVLDLTPAHFSYTASKAALWALTRTLAQSLAPRIRVNAIGPGPTVPPPSAPAGWFEQRSAELPLGRAADANDIADGVIHIVAMRAMTGQMIALDGGEHLGWAQPDSGSSTRN